MESTVIQVLLATYNGADYLQQQLDSLLSQTMTDWQLLVHDDHSSDGTLDILETYQKSYPERIRLLTDGITFHNARDNFVHLLGVTTSDYVMFCDQDDVWLPSKIEKTFNRMKEVECFYDDMPIVVHTDLSVVDESLGYIAPSMFEYQGLNKSIHNVLQILVRNSVTGCTMMMNRKAIDVSLPIQTCAVMHDWWIAANVIKHHGVVSFIDEPLIKYRQHSANSIGAKKKSVHSIIPRCLTYMYHQDIRDMTWNQAKYIDPSLTKLYFFWKKVYFTIKDLF